MKESDVAVCEQIILQRAKLHTAQADLATKQATAAEATAESEKARIAAAGEKAKLDALLAQLIEAD